MIKSNILSIIAGLLIVITITSIQFYQKRWEKEMGVIRSDAKGYYGYLPAAFIHHDLKFEHPEVYAAKNNNAKVYFSTTPEGENYIKYSLGLSILYSPFFFTSHALSDKLGYPSDGYSTPYQFAISISAIFYLILGLIFLSKLLRQFFSDSTTAIVLSILFLGTNILNYYTESSALSHIYSFAIISIFLYCSFKWIKENTLKWTLLSGLFGGLMVLIRPVDIIYLLFILLYQVNSRADLKNRISFLFQNIWRPLIFGFSFFIFWIPQFLYWKYIFGSFINYSYSGEKFFFLKPKILLSLFDYRNGWLVYTPIMIFSLIGLAFLKKRNKDLFTFSIIAIPFYIYVVSSWWCWWYVGFGNRAYINLYPILALPLGYFIEFLIARKLPLKLIGSSIIILLIGLNLFQHYQFTQGSIHWGRMTQEAYWDSFLRSKPSQLFYTKLRSEDNELAHQGINAIKEPIYDTTYFLQEGFEKNQTSNFEIPSPKHIDKSVAFEGSSSYRIFSNEFYCLNHNIPCDSIDEIYISAWIKNPKNTILVLNNPKSEIENIKFYRASSEIHQSKKEWKQVHIWAKIPGNLGIENLEFYIWNKGGENVWVDEIQIVARKVKYEVVVRQ